MPPRPSLAPDGLRGVVSSVSLPLALVAIVFPSEFEEWTMKNGLSDVDHMFHTTTLV